MFLSYLIKFKTNFSKSQKITQKKFYKIREIFIKIIPRIFKINNHKINPRASKAIYKILRLLKKFTKLLEKFLNKILNFYQCKIFMINHEN